MISLKSLLSYSLSNEALSLLPYSLAFGRACAINRVNIFCRDYPCWVRQGLNVLEFLSVGNSKILYSQLLVSVLFSLFFFSLWEWVLGWLCWSSPVCLHECMSQGVGNVKCCILISILAACFFLCISWFKFKPEYLCMPRLPVKHSTVPTTGTAMFYWYILNCFN